MQQAQNGLHRLPLMMWSPLFWFGAQFGPPAQPQNGEAKANTAPLQSAQAALNVGGGVMKASAQATSEVMGLVSRRTQALLAFTAEAAKCRAPQDMMSLQMRYWQTALQQHTEAAQRIAAAWNIALPQLPDAAIAPMRDLKSLAEGDTVGVVNGLSPQPGRSRDDRRSAA